MFKRMIPREVISNLDFETDSLALIVKMISERHKYPLDTFAFEFYSHEGYPLNVNEFSERCKYYIALYTPFCYDACSDYIVSFSGMYKPYIVSWVIQYTVKATNMYNKLN